MRIYATILLFCGLAAFSQGAEPLAVLKKGTWISDKEATLKWIDAQRPNHTNNTKLRAIFGKMTISFTDDSVVTTLDGQRDERPQKVIGQTTREVAAIVNDVLLKRDVVVVIEIDEDENGYWIYNSQFDIKEHFVPVK